MRLRERTGERLLAGDDARVCYRRSENTPFEMNKWIAEFEIRIWGGGGLRGGADGMTFAFVRQTDYSLHGGTILAFGGDGYGVEFDTYPYENAGDPRGQHIGIISGDVYNHLASVVIPDGLRDGNWHQIRVSLDSGLVDVSYDGIEVLSDCIIPDFAPFVGFFGFTAATGNGYEWHVIRNMRVYR